MPKVLWIIHGAEVYGERRAIESLSGAVRQAGWDVEILSLTNGMIFQSLKGSGFPGECLGFKSTPSLTLSRSRPGRLGQVFKLLWHQVALARRLTRELRHRRPDAVHLLSINMLPGIALAAKRNKIPCFWEMTREFTTSRGRLAGRVLAQTLRFHTLANSVFTASTLPKLDPPAHVMLLGANADRWDPQKVSAADREKLGIPADATVLLIVARLEPSKGQSVVAESLSKLKDENVHLVVVGDSENMGYSEEFRKALKAQQMESRVHIVGYSETPEMYYKMCDVVVNARLDAESFGLSVVEAMLMGKPALVHALGGPAETIVDGETGWHIKEPTVDAFAAGIRRALADKPRWQEMGAAARKRALARFTTEFQAARYMEIVRPHLAKRTSENQ